MKKNEIIDEDGGRIEIISGKKFCKTMKYKNDEIKKELFALKNRSEKEYNDFFEYWNPWITKYNRRAIELNFGLADGIEHTFHEIDEIMYKEMHKGKILKELKNDKERSIKFVRKTGIEINTTPAVGHQFLLKVMRKLEDIYKKYGITNRKYIQKA